MNGKKSVENFVVFLTHGDELFARCYHRYYNGEIIERQRYVFAKDGCCRYGYDNHSGWSALGEFREPVFCSRTYGYQFDNSYRVLNFDAYKKSCMQYSQLDKYSGDLCMEYLKIYCKHPNLEYAVKQGFERGVLKELYSGYWGGRRALKESELVNWKSNDLLKMLGLNRTEFKMLKGNEIYYDIYISYRNEYPKLSPEEVMKIVRVFKGEHGSLDSFCKLTNHTPQRIARYLDENNIRTYDYRDFLGQCSKLEYNLHDTAICFPNDFDSMHTRLSEIIIADNDRLTNEHLKKRMSERKKLEYIGNDFMIVQPSSVSEIINEGKLLSHCVGGYAERHAEGKLNILFLRKKSEPNKPFYTVEVSADFKIIQCRGYRNNNANNPKPQEIIDFEKQYQNYLDTLRIKKARKTA